MLILALLTRLLWVCLFQGEIGGDAIRYLWISEHVRRGEWLLLPQLFSSPLLPVIIGLLSRLTGDPALTATGVGVIMNTLAVGLAMMVFLQLFPTQPVLAWFTGLGLACNHVWCRLAPFALTENLFYPLLMGYFWLLLRFRQLPTRWRGLALGTCWGALYLSREIGLFIGALGFLAWLGDLWWQNRRLGIATKFVPLAKLCLPLYSILSVILVIWMYWFYTSLGIVSLGEGQRFYATYTRQFDRQSESTYPGYANGEFSFFRLHPYELMEYTRFPRPGDPRYPKGTAWQMFAHPVSLAGLVWDNLKWSLKEFQRVTLVGFFFLFVVLPWRWWQGRLSAPPRVLWFYGFNWSILALTFLGPLREARLIGWFFPWLYLSLGIGVTWAWTQLGQWLPGKIYQYPAKICLVGLVCFTFLFPQYFKEVPRRWQVRQEPHIHQLAASHILVNSGKGTVISSREAEVAYRAGGFWIGQPNADANQLLEWLYLGGADFFLIHDKYGIGSEQEIFWSTPGKIERTIPELKLVASFDGVKNVAYGHQARLFRFTSNPEKLAQYRQKYPWAGTHPGEAGAVAVSLP
ncbi:MAG TPA: hypothetical protein VLR91_02810, partial [Thermodesulfobacteriota bacterium]|nr:hypothetical protein [Thermodesulfobacteriota bacterium]